MRFIKMHGAGNDYIFVDCFEESVPADPAGLAETISDRHTGVGGDGLILILPSENADARMRMWNADGSEAEMCGNGIRCVGRFLVDSGRVTKSAMQIETAGGMRSIEVGRSDIEANSLRVDMGRPILESVRIPTTLPGDPPTDVILALPDCPKDWGPTEAGVTCVSMGNPHCVLFSENWSDAQVLGLGPMIERHSAFPQRTNVGFAEVVSASEIVLRVWERGSAETQACGTGACAAVVAGALTGRLGRPVKCRLPGGELRVEWPPDGPVFLSGPAVEVFRGDWPQA